MLPNLAPYLAYRDSGVPWLGQVPPHWEVRRLKHVCSMQSGEGITAESIELVDEYPVYGGNGVRGYTSAFTHDGVFPLVGRQGALCGNVHTADGKFWASEHAVVASPAKFVNPHWLARALHVMDLGQYSLAAAQPGLAVERILTLPLPLPPPEEQAAIVRFLDHADRRIRRYVRAKQRLIALLEEQKQAIIHHAVTRGLDPNVRLKPSGVEWLGDIPEHWEVRRFKFVAGVTSKLVDPRTEENRKKLLIAPNHIKSGTGVLLSRESADQQGAESGKYEVRAGQLVYSKIRPNLRKATIADVDGLCSADMYPLTVREGIVRPEFLLNLVLSAPFTRYVVDCSLRVAMPKVNREALGDAWLWLPSLEEQDRILDHIHESTSDILTAIERTKRESAFLREYRTRLIADVVTGKLDVREAAARLPEAADEPEPLDDLDVIGDVDDGEVEELEGALEEAVT